MNKNSGHNGFSRVRLLSSPLILFVILGTLLSSFTEAATVTASLNRNSVARNESAILTITVNGGEAESIPRIPPQSKLTVEYSGQSTQFIFDGQSSQSLAQYSYRITPADTGTYSIPPIEVKVKGQPLSTPPLTLNVSASNTPTPPDSGLNQEAFLKLVIPKTNVYVGEVFPVEIQLFLRVDPYDLRFPVLQSEGFVVGQLPQPVQGHVQHGNVIYRVYKFTFTASAAKHGTLTLGPAQCNVGLILPRHRDPNDPFDAFFSGLRGIRQPATLNSDTVSMEVRQLPTQGKPEDFTGAIGEFSMKVGATPTSLTVGDPITLKIQIVGKGNLEALDLPKPDWKEFKTYPATASISTSDPLKFSGVKNFEQVVVPENAEVKEIPQVAFSYFNPEKHSYQVLKNPAIPIEVRPGSAAPAPPSILASQPLAEQAPVQNDISHIKPYFGAAGAIRPPLPSQSWFLLIQAIPMALLGVAIAWRKRKENLENNPRLRRRIRVDELVIAGLNDLRQAADANNSELFYSTAFRLMQERIGEKLDLPATSITEAVLADHLYKANAQPDLVTDLNDLFHLCNQAKYASNATPQQLSTLVPKIESALHRLKEIQL